jgi:hypothetical protein
LTLGGVYNMPRNGELNAFTWTAYVTYLLKVEMARQILCLGKSRGVGGNTYHHLDKLFIVDQAISIDISFTDHFGYFMLCELFI